MSEHELRPDPDVVDRPAKPMRLIRWFRSSWADAKRSGEWMVDAPAFQSSSPWQRWVIRTQPRNHMLYGLLLATIPLLLALVFVLVLLVILVGPLSEALA